MSVRAAGLLALLLPASAWAADEASTPAPAVEDGRIDRQELLAFREVVSRFSERMTEFEKDARRWVDFREAEERALLDGNYSALIRDMDEDDRALRSTAARRFEAFLDKYPNSPNSAHVMFRLAELYFEDTEESFIAADEGFRRFMDNLSEDSFDNLPEEPKKDYSQSIALYRRIIENYPDYQYIDGTYYMLGYVLSEPNSVQFDEKAGLQHFLALVDKFPDSQFGSVAHLRIGEYYFDQPGGLDLAIPHYEKVVAMEGAEGSLYDEGLYKLAWSHYRKSNYDQALVLLNQLLDWSKRYHFARTGRDSAMAPEAIEYTAISFSDLGFERGQHPLEVAKAFYGQAGAREFEDDVYKRLADVLTQQSRFDQAIDVYTYIQDRWPNDPENPDYMWKVATLHMTKQPPDPEATQVAIAALNERYNDDSAWWKANRNNPDALAVARGYIEKSLAGVATRYHTVAIETGNPADYLKAADFYRQYLSKFPFATDYYEIQWYLAETLYRGGRDEDAVREYTQLLKAGDHNYKDGSLWFLRQIAYEKVRDQFGDVKTLPPNAVVEKKIELPNGTERPVYILGQDHKNLVELSDRLVAADFRANMAKVEQQLAETTDKEQQELLERELEYMGTIAEGLRSNRHAIAYQAAQILFAHGRYEEARPRLWGIVNQWPETDEAAYSAQLLVDSHINEEDWVNVRLVSADLARRPLGRSAAGGLASEGLKDLEQKAALKIVEQLVEEGKREEAAQGYLDFLKTYGNRATPETRKLALYNAAHNFEQVGRLDESTRLFKDFLREYPEDDLSLPLYFRLAENHARALELNEAVQSYEQLFEVTRRRNLAYRDAPAALFNAAFLRVGMGDFEGAALAFERYEDVYPSEPDAEQVLFMAAEQWRRVSPSKELDFLQRYLRQYENPPRNPDHVIEAKYRIAAIHDEAGRSREADGAWRDLASTYDRLAAAGPVGPLGRKYAAAARLREVLAAVEAFKAVPENVKKNPDRYAEMILKKKDELPRIEQQTTGLITQYKDFDSSSAALYALGTSYYAIADMLWNAPIPPEIEADPDLLELYQQTLDEFRLPAEDKGKARLLAALELAKTEKAWSEWQTRTLEFLAKRFPNEYAREKEEVRGAIIDTWLPSGGPISLPDSTEPAAARTPGGTDGQAGVPTPQEAP